MAEAELGLYRVLEGGSPLELGVYDDLAEKDRLVGVATALAPPDWPVVTVTSAPDALERSKDRVLLIIDPLNQIEAVRHLDRNRDHLVGAPARLLLLLDRDGAGMRELADAPSLAAWLRSCSFLAEAHVSRENGALAFEKRHGMNVREWLRLWREGTLPDTTDNNLSLAEALAIEEAK
jgi:hypothetical protein